MAVSVHEEAIDLHLGLLEAVGPPESGPWPLLKPLGRTETRTFRAVVLENDFLRVTIIPELGGRIAQIHDRRTGIDILPRPTVLEPVEGGPRGVDLPFGIEVTLDGESRLNALGPVRVAEAEDGVWLAETVSGNGLSWHLRVSLREDRAAIGLELRVYLRSDQSVRVNPGFRTSGLEREGNLWFSTDGGFYRREGEATLDGGLVRFDAPRFLRPHQTDVADLELVLFSGIGRPLSGGMGGAFSLEEGRFRLQAAQAVSNAKAVLLTSGGQTLEAPLTLDPFKIEEIDLQGIAPSALVAMDGDRQPLIEWAPTTDPAGPSDPYAHFRDLTVRELRAKEFHANDRSRALLERARRAMVAQDYRQAAELFERVLLFNGNDPLAWWGLAAARRLAGDEEERPELMNARWLAPLEPMVRAEAFLATSMDAEADPGGLLEPLDETPDAFIEVAAILIDHGLWADAGRWLAEALKRHDLGALHLLAAYAHLQGSGLRVEADRHFRRYLANPGPPYPWRPVEVLALHSLQAILP